MKIILITSTFPYSIGEVFLENELNFFSRLKNLKIKILPSKKEGSIRKYDNKFKVIPKNITKYFDKKILTLNNLKIGNLDHADLEFLQLKGLLDKDLIKPLYLS